MEKILKYKNNLNNLKLGNMTIKEQDIFFSILYILKKNKNYEAEIEFIELKRMIGSRVVNKQFIDTLRRMIKKFHQSVQEYEFEEGKYLIFNVLDDTIIDTKNNVVKTKLKKSFQHLLEINEDTKEYSSINLKEMCDLKSSYSKIFYRYVKQWETVGIKNIKIRDFKEMLGVTQNYKFSAIDIKVLDPILRELSPIFIGLNVEKIKSSSKGSKIESLTFTWQRVQRKKKVVQKKEIPRGIIKLKPSLGEEDLRKFEAEEKKISEIIDVNLADKVLKTENKVRENITREDYDRMYKEYLKNNNIAHNKFIKLAFDRSNESKFFIIK